MKRGRIVASLLCSGLMTVACQTDVPPSSSVAASVAVVETPTIAPTVRPTATPATAPAPTAPPIVAPTSTTHPTATAQPAGPGGFVTTAPPSATSTWSGIRWRKLAPSDPLRQLRAVTRWRGGYLAVGEPIVSGDTSHSSVWSSTDGRSWRLLGSDAFGPGTVVVGVAPTETGVVAMTLQGGPPGGDCYGGRLTCWKLSPPLRAWTSADGTAWIAHDGPDIFPDPNSEDPGDSVDPMLLAGPHGTLLITSPGRPMATSRDGVAWEIVPTSALPRGWDLGGVAVLGSSFVAVGGTPSRSLALTSADGRTWTSHPRSCPAESLVRGPRGVIGEGGTGMAGTGIEKWFWCSSLNGVAWRTLPGLRPIGYMPGSVSQECQNACADGTLTGDGERMIAYRGWRTQAGWTSFDGRSWHRLTFVGHPERSKGWLDDTCTNSLVITAIGVTCRASNGSVWFGAPQT